MLLLLELLAILLDQMNFLKALILFTSVVISVIEKALFEKCIFFTWKGEVLSGKAITFEAKPASKLIATKGAICKLSVVEAKTITFAFSLLATCLITSA